MAISHIGRVLRERAERQRLNTAMDVLDGAAAADALQLRWFQGYAEGIKWVISQLEDIESEGN